MYTVKSGEQYAKITITDSETVKFSDKWDVFGVKGDDITVKLNSTDSGDGVYNTDDTGGAVIIAHGRRLDTMYLTGTGDVIVWAGASAVDCPFSKGAKGGGSGGGCNYKGTTTTPISNGSTTNPITIDGEEYTAVFGDIVVYGYTEFVFDGSAWSEFGRPFDTTPTSGSANAVTSDGIYKMTPWTRGTGQVSTYGGSNSSSSGTHALAYGYNAVASGAYSVAIGFSTLSNKQYLQAFGFKNNPKANDLFEIGNGNANARSNIVEVTSTSMNVNGDIQRDGVGIDDYTTTERKIGKWIDGSDLYQRTFEVTGLSKNTWNNSILDTSDIKIVDFTGLIYWLDNQAASDSTPLNYYASGSDNCFTCINTAQTDMRIYPTNTSSDMSIDKAIITIKYTKPSVQSNLMQTAPTEEVSETPIEEEDDMR